MSDPAAALHLSSNEMRPEGQDPARETTEYDRAPVRILLFAFMFMFQGYGIMNGNPQHVLKVKLNISHEDSGAFQNATASFQLSKLLMRVLQIGFLVFLNPRGICQLAYVMMIIAVMVPIIFVWGAGVTDLWVVYLQYICGGIAVGLFEGTFLSVVSALGKNTKTFVIMGCPLGFAMHNIVLGTFQQWGMPTILYYVYTVCCLPIGMLIFHFYAPQQDPRTEGKGCQVVANSLSQAGTWMPQMIPWFIAKFCGNFVLEDAFPLLFNTFNTDKVPLGSPDSTDHLVPFAFYTAWYWFVMMAAGDTVSRRVPQYIRLSSWKSQSACLILAIVCCVAGEALNFLLLAIVSGFAVFIAFFGNGFIYGLSAKYIDTYIPEEHRYTAYNVWCFFGDLGGYAGQSSLSVKIANGVCDGRHYTYVCHEKTATQDQLSASFMGYQKDLVI